MSRNTIEIFLGQPIGLAAAVRGHLRFKNSQKIFTISGNHPDENAI